jgi:hypothetical protein
MDLYIIKAIYDKPTANIILNREKLKNISTKVRNETRVSTLSTPTHYSLEFLARAIGRKKK